MKLILIFLILLFQITIQTEPQQNEEDELLEDYQKNLRNQCLTIQKSICMGKNQKEIGLQSFEDNLVGQWKFDDKYSVDSSGNSNDIYPPPKVGFQQGGEGYSASYDGTYLSEIQHIKEYDSPEFTISFWIFLIQSEKGSGWKTILHKGETNQELTPTIQLWPNENRLHVKFSTDFDWNENLDSKSGIIVKRWTHLTFTFSNMLVQIFMNGILDSQAILQGQLRRNKGNFHIGKDPWHQGPIFYIDDLRIYDKILKKHEILGIGSPSSVFSGDSYATLGCESCSYQQAIVSCPEKYHLCSFPEIYAGAYQIARTMGWFRMNPYFWVRVPEQQYETEKAFLGDLFDPNVFKLGICCLNP